MFRTIANTVRFVRALDRENLYSYAQTYADDVLGRYGYMRRRPVMSALSLGGAFGVGLALGTGFGILIAPQSGAETRKNLGDQFGKAVNRVREVAGRKNGRGRVITEDPNISHGGPIGHS